MDKRNQTCATSQRVSERAAFVAKWQGIAIRWRVQVDELHDKARFHPLIAGAAIYLTEVMASVNSSIGGALIVVTGGLAFDLYRKLTRCNCRVE